MPDKLLVSDVEVVPDGDDVDEVSDRARSSMKPQCRAVGLAANDQKRPATPKDGGPEGDRRVGAGLAESPALEPRGGGRF